VSNTLDHDYLFTSTRLGFRNWRASDLDDFQQINGDPEVMRHFPQTLDRDQTAAMIHRLDDHYQRHGYTYYAVESLATLPIGHDSQPIPWAAGSFLGFVGLCYQEFPVDFSPCVDIGWRLRPEVWRMGLATEGATRCLQQAFDALGLTQVYAIALSSNVASIQVMKRIGMQFHSQFNHPALASMPKLGACVAYQIRATDQTPKPPH